LLVIERGIERWKSGRDKEKAQDANHEVPSYDRPR
jgi:hypothetical protein